MSSKPHYNVLIATPGMSFDSQYIHSILETTSFLSSNNIKWKFLNNYSSIVSVARELTLKDGLVDSSSPGNGEYTYDKIFWIDSDISWELKDFIKILNSKKDVTTGVYPVVFKNKAAIVKDRDVDYTLMSPEEIYELNGSMQKIWASGMGFMCLKSGIVEKLEKPWFWNPYIKFLDKDGNPFDRRNASEDIGFCSKINDAGFEIWMDSSVIVKHHKSVGFEIARP